MVELFEQNEKKFDRQSSKGNQLKWENEGTWYKADYTGYEGLSEYIISHLLKYSTLDENEYVLYDLEQIRYKSAIYKGVKSKNFLSEGQQLITLERLYKNLTGRSLYQSVFKIEDKQMRFVYLASEVERYTGLKRFDVYLNKLFTIDAVFLNEDRHMHNIAVILNPDGSFMYCPIFDNGAGLLADTTMEYPMGADVYTLMKDVQAKTISTDFDEQLDISEQVSKTVLKFSFTHREVDELLNKADVYSEEEKDRIRTIMYQQIRKYQYLFQSR